ncbi:bifunctional diguanylate cyclase/phosphodiesterase [Pseudomonas sp. MYb185]|uniref:putative bifunctional diguanylate cyclase/phosphodiesterase n=1 Tax=Pseudomonas sp. MYb185 TaxID=1848729 RepID=UPI0011B0EE89|nr:EAL domain-containing protein [Pseudomonas sp. MYb185]
MEYPGDEVDSGAGAASLLGRAGLDAAFLTAMFDALQDGVLVTDEQGTIRMANNAALELFRYTAGQLLGQHISLVISLPAALSDPDPQPQSWYTGGITGRELAGWRRGSECLTLRLSVGEFMWRGQRLFVNSCHDITEQRRYTEHIAFLASHDSLTGCPNREQFLQALTQALQECRSRGHSLAVLYIDLDGFKAVNDKHGHRLGDLLLKRVAERLRRRLRDHDLLGRLGGDEFVVLAHLDNDPELAQRVAARLVASLQQPFSVEGLALQVTASIGISLLNGQQEADDLLDEADIAMYQAKLDGGDRVRVFSMALLERTEKAHRQLTALRRAVAQRQLELHYQPQFDMRSLRPSGLEAMLRWRSEQRLVMPEEFMPMAQAHGLAADIERWALQQACRDKAQLLAAGLLDARVTVRIGTALLRTPGFAQLVQQVLQENGLAPRHLELEVIEETAVDPSTPVRQNLLALAETGVSLGVGGFGTGHASLARLKGLPASTLKIDRLFTAGLPDNIGDRALTRAVVEMAAVLGMRTLADGVETVAQMACLQGLGCVLGQGCWYATPMPLPELGQWLEDLG